MASLFRQSLSGHPFPWPESRGHLGAAFAVLVLLGMASPPAIAAGHPKRGNELFQQYCSGCHGPQGRGGRKSGFMPRPKNLTVKGYTDALPDEYLFTVATERRISPFTCTFSAPRSRIHSCRSPQR